MPDAASIPMLNLSLHNFDLVSPLLSAAVPWKPPHSQHRSDWRAPGSGSGPRCCGCAPTSSSCRSSAPATRTRSASSTTVIARACTRTRGRCSPPRRPMPRTWCRRSSCARTRGCAPTGVISRCARGCTGSRTTAASTSCAARRRSRSRPSTSSARAPMPTRQLRAEQREALRRLIADVQRLPEQQRSALLMRELGGIPYADLSGALGVSVPAVKSLLVRARVGLVQASEARDTACAAIREDLIVAHDRGVRAERAGSPAHARLLGLPSVPPGGPTGSAVASRCCCRRSARSARPPSCSASPRSRVAAPRPAPRPAPRAAEPWSRAARSSPEAVRWPAAPWPAEARSRPPEPAMSRPSSPPPSWRPEARSGSSRSPPPRTTIAPIGAVPRAPGRTRARRRRPTRPRSPR